MAFFFPKCLTFGSPGLCDLTSTVQADVLSSKIENAQWAEKKDHNALWHLRNRNALWHVKICHDAEVVLWLLKEMTTTSSDFMKIPQAVAVVTFYSHNAMWDKFEPAERSVSFSLVR